MISRLYAFRDSASWPTRKAMRRLPLILLMAFMAYAFLFPIFIVFTNSFMSGFEIVTRYTHVLRPGNVLHARPGNDVIHFVRLTLIPTFASFGQYVDLLIRNPDYLSKFWNSVALALPIVIGQAVISAPAAYAFEMTSFRRKEVVYFIYIVVMLMPLQVALVPNFLMADLMGLRESRLAIILPGMVNPFGVFIMRQFLRSMSKDYIEAAQVDGAGHLRIIALIVAPLFKPAVAALMMLVFVENWNLVEQPRIFLELAQQPLSLYLSQMARANLDIVFAASFFYLLPPVLVFLYGQEFMVEGIQLSGIR